MLGDFFGSWEVVLILAVVLILLFLGRHVPKIARELSEGFFEFRKSLDQEAHKVGASLGGIYGRPAAGALTPDNQTAELYDPDVFHREERTRRATKWMRFRRWLRLWKRQINRLIRALSHTKNRAA
jgi:Sec-independent protein translocase protein TatA